MAELYLCVHAAEFPAQALLRLRPEMRARPVAVLEGTPPLERVCACNAIARRQGIQRGATRVEAETFTGVTLLRRSRAEEDSARAALLECAGRFSPRVEHIGRDLDFCCVADIAGTELLLGPPDQVAVHIREAMRLLGIPVSVAVSRDFHTSVAIAGCVEGTCIVPAGHEREALAPLPLHALSLSPQQAETFHLWGIHTLGQLAELPAVELIARMGQDAQCLRQLARGEHPHLFRPIQPVFVLREQVEFEEPVELLDSLLFVISPMLGQLIARAASRSLAIASLDLHLRLDGNQSQQRTIKPALPSTDRKFLLKLVQLDLAAHPPQAGVLSLTLTAEPDHARKMQLGLFAPQLPDSSRLDVTLSHLAALVGEDRVGSPVLTDTHRPDSFRQTKLLLEKVDRGTITSQTRPALRRLRPALLLHVHIEHRRPASFFYDALPYTVTEAYGPWRAGGEWWAEGLWSLDEWDVIAESQQQRLCCVLVQEHASQQWRMEAVYD